MVSGGAAGGGAGAREAPGSGDRDGSGPAGGGTGVRVVLVTLASADAARAMARILVDEGRVACGSVLPGLTSVYRWEGEVREDAEALLLLKTTDEAMEGLLRRIPELHAYEVPEILALPVEEGHPPYLAWVRDEVRTGGRGQGPGS